MHSNTKGKVPGLIMQLVFECINKHFDLDQSELREIPTQLSALLHSQDLQKSGSFAISKKNKK